MGEKQKTRKEKQTKRRERLMKGKDKGGERNLQRTRVEKREDKKKGGFYKGNDDTKKEMGRKESG